jgi:hypothetical protein
MTRSQLPYDGTSGRISVFKIPIVTAEWNICTPTLFRFLPGQYADAFFADGSLRLSSFSQFRKHENEQKLDRHEGKTMFVHQTNQGGGQTIEAFSTHGTNAYVLSTTMRYDAELMKAFGCDSYIRINRSMDFGVAIARHISGLVSAFEGPCLYQSMKIIEKDLGYVDVNRFRDPKNPQQIRKDLLSEFILSQMEHYPLFMKDETFAEQSEYRFVWITRNEPSDYLDIKVPDAMQFCSKPNHLTE